MMKVSCPSCGGELNFRSRTSVFTVCSYCRSNIVRHDVDLKAIGKQAELQPDMSPIQLGSRGKYRNKSFFVSGRVIVHWENGRWNEWYITFNDGSSGWLAEAQGDFSILFSPKKEVHIPAPNKTKIGNKVSLDNKNYKVVDIKEMECMGSEGELPYQGLVGRKSISIDLVSADGDFATIEYNSEDGASVYLGKYTSLGKLGMQNLRRFEGWGRP